MKSGVFLPLFAVALLAWLTALAPLGLALRLAGLPQAGLGAEFVEGSVWGGRMEAARWRGVTLGDMNVALEPLSLLTGSPRVRLEVRAPGASLRGSLLAGGRTGVSGLEAEGPLAAFPIAFPAALKGSLRAADTAIVFAKGACRQARGRLAMDVRVLSGPVNWAAPPLEGGWSCEEGVAVARLQGEADTGRVDVAVRLQASGALAVETRVSSVDPQTGAALFAAGFAPGPDGYVRLDEGSL